jgi:hypothetical protein
MCELSCCPQLRCLQPMFFVVEILISKEFLRNDLSSLPPRLEPRDLKIGLPLNVGGFVGHVRGVEGSVGKRGRSYKKSWCDCGGVEKPHLLVSPPPSEGCSYGQNCPSMFCCLLPPVPNFAVTGGNSTIQVS